MARVFVDTVEQGWAIFLSAGRFINFFRPSGHSFQKIRAEIYNITWTTVGMCLGTS
jgi:hypothetical protein